MDERLRLPGDALGDARVARVRSGAAHALLLGAQQFGHALGDGLDGLVLGARGRGAVTDARVAELKECVDDVVGRHLDARRAGDVAGPERAHVCAEGVASDKLDFEERVAVGCRDGCVVRGAGSGAIGVGVYDIFCECADRDISLVFLDTPGNGSLVRCSLDGSGKQAYQ